MDDFRVHLETIRLNRLVRDEENYRDDLEFLEAKLKFLIFMSQRKRTAKEIEEFLTQFSSKISSRLSAIQIVKLSEDHIKETREEIERIKGKIKETLLLIKAQRKVVAELAKKKPAPKSAKLIFSSTPVVSPSLDGIEVFTIEEDDEEEQNEEIDV